MKLNLKKLKFKELFVEHVEKGVLGIMGVCLLLFIISALRRDKLPPDLEPDKLVLESGRATEHIEKSSPNEELKKIRPEDAIVYSERVRRPPVDLLVYDTKVPIDGPVVEAKILREEPQYLSVKELQTGTGFAPFATIDPNAQQEQVVIKRKPRPGIDQEMEMQEEVRMVEGNVRKGYKATKDSKLIIKYWAMVTGLVPVREQRNAYVSAFENAVSYDAEQDVPKYLGAITERAEVTSGDLQNLKWTRIQKDEGFMEVWEGEIDDPVMPEYVNFTFAMPLGPRVGEDWEPYIGHAKIPFQPKRNQVGGRGEGPMMGGRGMGPIGGMGRGEDFEGGFDERMPGGGGGMAEEEEEGAEEFERGGRKKKQTMIEQDPEEIRRGKEVVAQIGERTIKGVDHLLYRFCDFTVKPGKRYVYRVKLGLVNPNKGIPVKYLKNPTLAKAPTVTTVASEISPVVLIPYGDKILAGPVTPPTVLKEPTADIRIVQIKEDVGVEVPMHEEVFRGSVANFLEKTTEYIDPRTRKVEEYTGNFQTDAVLVDMRGGRPVLAKDKTVAEPGELLVLTRTGQLVALNEFDDEDVWSNYIVPEEKPTGMQGMDEMPFDPERRMPRGVRPGAPMRNPPVRNPKAKGGQQMDLLGEGMPQQPQKKPLRQRGGER